MSNSEASSSGVKRQRLHCKEKVLLDDLNETPEYWSSDEEYDEIVDSEISYTEESSEDEDGQIEANTPFWSKQPSTQIPKQFEFQGSPGLREGPQSLSPIHYFFMIATKDFLNLVVTSTNDYGRVMYENRKKPKTRLWTPVIEEEIIIFLGLLFHMGTIKLNRLKDYWRKDVLFNIPIFSQCMSRDRFMIILRALHFSVMNEDDSSDRLWRVHPIVNLFNDTMENIYSPIRELSVDEAMILWHGRLIIRQQMRGKPHKYGIKMHMLAENNGLVIKLVIHAGSGDKVIGGNGLPTEMAKKLLEGKLGLGHSIYMDKQYNSVDLSRYLLSHDTYSTGTLHSARKNNPAEVIDKKLEKGEEVHRYSEEGVCVLKWKDRREILLISSEHDATMVTVANRMGVKKSKPKLLVEHEKAMGMIDRQELMLSYYPMEKNTLPWYKKVGIHIFHLILSNSFHLYSKQFQAKKEKPEFYTFRLEIIRSLLASRLQTPPTPPINKGKIHTPVFVPKHAESGRSMRRQCRNCKRKGMRKDTCYMCTDCPDEPGLCLVDCFRIYHNY